MGIDYEVQREDDDGDGFRRSCFPNIFLVRRDRLLGTDSYKPQRKDTSGANKNTLVGGSGGGIAVFDEQLVSVLSPVPRGYQQLGVSQRDTTPTTSSSAWSDSLNTPTPIEWPLAGSNHSHPASNSRMEFHAVVSPGTQKDIDHLLHLPTPSDRSAKRRLQYERDVRTRQSNAGGQVTEMEPPGRWGESILQPRMRSYNVDSASPNAARQVVAGQSGNDQQRTPPLDETPPREQMQFPPRQKFQSPPSTHRRRGANELKHPDGTPEVADHFSHPTFSVPFSLASTPPPPPPPALPAPPPRNQVASPAREPTFAKHTLPRLRTNQKISPQRQEDEANESRDLSCYISSSGSSDSQSSGRSFDVAVVKRETVRQRNSPQDSSILENVDVLNGLVMEHIKHGEYENALSVLQHVLKVQEERYGAVSPQVASSQHNMGIVHAKRASAIASAAGESEQRHCRAQAVSCFQAAARIARDALGPTHPNVAVSLVRIGLVLLDSRQYQNALVTFKEALRLRVAALGPHHELVATVLNNMGLCCAQIGSFLEAKEYLDAAISIQRRIVHKGGGEQEKLELALSESLFNLAGVNMEWIRQEGCVSSRVVEAESCFTEVLEIRTRILGSDSAMVLQVKTLLDIAKALPRTSALRDDSVSSVRRNDSQTQRLNSTYKQQSDSRRRIGQTKELPIRCDRTMESPIGENADRKEHLYSLLVSLVENDPRRRKPTIVQPAMPS